jgi:two-component system sensor histidine kinase QseC
VRSIRSFLLARLLGGSTLVLAAAGVAAYFTIARSLERQFDRNLADRVQGFASILFQVEDEVSFEFSDQLMPEYSRGERPSYFEIAFAGGELMERSESLRGRALETPEPPAAEPRHWSAPLPDGRPGRYVSQTVEVHHVYPEEGPDRPQAARVSIVIARGREELVRAERIALAQCALVALALIALVAAVSWHAVTRGLAPSRRLAEALDRIEVDRLPERGDVGPLPRELEPMSRTTNALIRRVQAALERERRTTADIAHELRTPISELVMIAEVALRNGRDAEGLARSLGGVRDVAWRMGRSVATLLKLARLEQGSERSRPAQIDLGGLLQELLRSAAAVEQDRELEVEDLVARGELVEADEDVLRIVVSNLAGNALHYAPRGGRVRFWLERDGGGAWRLVIENDAPDLTPEDLRWLTEPFWRKDGARADRNRSGLGLALSQALVERVGLRLELELQGSRFRAILASAAPAHGEGTASSSRPPLQRAVAPDR